MQPKTPIRLVELTPEAKVLAALVEGDMTYGALRRKTGLSDRWLSKKLSLLLKSGLVEGSPETKGYRLRDKAELMALDPFFSDYLRRSSSLSAKARLAGHELGRMGGVLAVVLFGSVAKGTAKEDSDIDFLIVTNEGVDSKVLDDAVYELMLKYDAPMESVHLNFEEVLVNLHEMTAFAFAVLEGYEVLHDVCGLAYLLSEKRRKMNDEWEYDEEAGAWIQKNLLPTSPLRKSN